MNTCPACGEQKRALSERIGKMAMEPDRILQAQAIYNYGEEQYAEGLSHGAHSLRESLSELLLRLDWSVTTPQLVIEELRKLAGEDG